MIIVQTPRLTIREFLPDEEMLLVELYRDQRVTKYVPKRTEDDTRKQFSEAILSYKDNTGLGRWGVFNPIDGDFMGVCILKPADSDPTRIELGLRIGLQILGTWPGYRNFKGIDILRFYG